MVAVLPDFPFFGLKIAKMKFKTIVLPRNYGYQGFRGFWTGNEQFKSFPITARASKVAAGLPDQQFFV